MSIPTFVNSMSTDTVSQTILDAAGATSPVAQSVLAQAFSQSLSLSLQNAALQQQATEILADAALTASLAALKSSIGGSEPGGTA